jgi:hypothetical protein
MQCSQGGGQAVLGHRVEQGSQALLVGKAGVQQHPVR